MKIKAEDLPARLTSSAADCHACLIHGQHEARVLQLRDQVIGALGGPAARDEMRLEILDGPGIVAKPNALFMAVNSTSFFAEGDRVVVIDGASEPLAPIVEALLPELDDDSARMVITARKYLRPASKLRKLFERHKQLVATAVFDNSVTVSEVRAMLEGVDLKSVSGDVLNQLTVRLTEYDPAMVRGVIEKLALYKLDDPAGLSSTDLDVCVPLTIASATEKLLGAVANHQAQSIGPAFRKLTDQESNPVSLCIQAEVIFRKILRVASDPEGIEAAVGRLRPPVFGPRRHQLINQAGFWGVSGARFALGELTHADLELRGTGKAPAKSLVERTFLRIACWQGR